MRMAVANFTKRLTLLLCGGIVALAFAGVATSEAADEGNFNDFHVQYDQVELLRLNEEGATIIVGNPSIADVSIQRAKLLAITGKTFGVTNLIVMNHAGQVITNRRLVVRADDQKVVNLNRGVLRESYNCAPKCQSVLTIGDEQAYYSRIAKAASDKFRVSDSIAEASQGGE